MEDARAQPRTELQLAATGERLVTRVVDATAIEHLHRYALARQWCGGKDVLDIASGEGFGSHLLAGAAQSVVGVDIDEAAVRHAQEKYRAPNLRYVTGAADQIPQEDGSLDVVVSFETLEHHDRHEAMMAEIKRVLLPGGLLIMSTPERRNYSEGSGYDNPFHVKELNLEEFRALLRLHFSHVRMLFQTIVGASIIAPEAEAQGFSDFSGDFYDIRVSEAIQSPLYNICFASDAPLAPVGCSLFEGDASIGREREEWIKHRQHLLEREQQLSDLLQATLNSRSFRLGHALTWPLRRLRGGTSP